MLRSRRARWMGVVLIGGVLLASSGPGVASAASPTTEEILAKVNEVLAALGGIKDGNSTLRWDQALPAAQRFVILPAFNNEAVLDKNTGLVWEKSPAPTFTAWSSALGACIRKTVGGLRGWRLPSVSELASLVDPTVGTSGPTLPPGHPFLNVQSFYWSASTWAADPVLAWYVRFGNGSVENEFKTFAAGNHWCVRGGMNADQY